ncbi:hypothetical protein [Corallococcus sp. EGB]|uniref:hypothetical protein n=1 Tax=Corallococcus sp. EGB TaxID=1521117 RepID=UPI001CBB7C1B|nr:hypothetical protein [Corallococcus sp. EGB]
MLASLCEAGLIEVQHIETGALARSHQEIERALAMNSCKPAHYSGFWYHLTDKGGAMWESLARPDWGRYSKGRREEEESFIEAGSRECAEAEFAWWSTDPSKTLLPGSEAWTGLQPWDATYWKTLSVGFRVHYRWTAGPKNHFAWHLWSKRRPIQRPWHEKPAF